MSDLLRRLLDRALGRAAVVQPMVGTRFGPEPRLLSERAGGSDAEPPRPALPEPPPEPAAD